MIDTKVVKYIKEYGTLDKVLADGRLTMDSRGAAPHIRVRDLARWCESQGRATSSLSKKEIDAFSY